ncbi:MAG: hypothetical protein KGZ97_07500 [Bacteroidetes bacterium]|nr:hypothetical protein [Bacteroidota bacterium]
MLIKGTAVKATPDFVRARYNEKFREWINALPETSKSIILDGVYATNWYPLTESVIIPTQKVGDMFFGGDHIMAAKELGRFSAEVALKGIYKLFVRVSSPHFVLSRASSVFGTYYNPSDITILEKRDKKAIMQFSGFDEKDKLIIHRISGWIEKTLEITLKSPLRIEVKSNVIGSKCTFTIATEWD